MSAAQLIHGDDLQGFPLEHGGAAGGRLHCRCTYYPLGLGKFERYGIVKHRGRFCAVYRGDFGSNVYRVLGRYQSRAAAIEAARVAARGEA